METRKKVEPLDNIIATEKKTKERKHQTKPLKIKYRAMTISLHSTETDWIKNITKILQKGGYPRASKSFVVREAIFRLMDELDGKQPQQVLENIQDHISKRMEGKSIQ